MERRRLGNTLEVSAVGLGCMGFSHAYGAPTEKEEAIRMIRYAFDCVILCLILQRSMARLMIRTSTNGSWVRP